MPVQLSQDFEKVGVRTRTIGGAADETDMMAKTHWLDYQTSCFYVLTCANPAQQTGREGEAIAHVKGLVDRYNSPKEVAKLGRDAIDFQALSAEQMLATARFEIAYHKTILDNPCQYGEEEILSATETFDKNKGLETHYAREIEKVATAREKLDPIDFGAALLKHLVVSLGKEGQGAAAAALNDTLDKNLGAAAAGSIKRALSCDLGRDFLPHFYMLPPSANALVCEAPAQSQ